RSRPASTSVAAPNRSGAGNGVPVPSSVTLKSCAQTAHVYAADVKARQANKIAKRRVMPISRLHACAGKRAYRATGCGVKWPAAIDEREHDAPRQAASGRLRGGAATSSCALFATSLAACMMLCPSSLVDLQGPGLADG